jgi:hypothetical protein
MLKIHRRKIVKKYYQIMSEIPEFGEEIISEWFWEN